MSLSHFGEFICDSTANQFTAQSQLIPSAASVEWQSMANPLRMRCELICINVEKKIICFRIRCLESANLTKKQNKSKIN